MSGPALPPGFQIDPALSQQEGTQVAVNAQTGKRIRWNPAPEGDAFLKTLPPQQAAQIKALAEGRKAFPSGMALAKPYWQQMLGSVAQYDPSFDEVNYNSRSKARSDWTSGKSAVNRTALNTVVGHLDHLDRAIDGLGNYSGVEPGPVLGIPLGPLAHFNNSSAHFLARQSGTDERLKDFEAAKTAVSNELTRVFRGSGGAEADIQGWMRQLDSASSPAALKQTVKSMSDLMNSRIEALGQQYRWGMGTTHDPIVLIDPDKVEALTRMRGLKSPAASSPAAGKRPALDDILK